MSLDDALPVASAAQLLGLSPQRVRALLNRGELAGEKIAGRWLVNRSAVERRVRDRRLSGRPYSSSHAWALILLADGDKATWLDPPNRSRLRRILREEDLSNLAPYLARRARRIHMRAHASDLSRIEAEPDVIRSGVSSASDHGLEIVAPGVLEAYVPAGRVAKLERRYHLRPSADANVIFHVVDGRWPFTADRRVAPKLAAVLDLLDDDDERTRRAAERALGSFKPANA